MMPMKAENMRANPGEPGEERAELEHRMRSYAALAFALAVEMEVEDIAERAWPSLQDDVCGIALFVASDKDPVSQLCSHAGFKELPSAHTLAEALQEWAGLAQISAEASEQVICFEAGRAPEWLGAACSSAALFRFTLTKANGGHGFVLFALRLPTVSRPLAAMLHLAAQRMGDCLVRPSRATESALADELSGSAVMKVLLIDDEPLLVSHVRRLLRQGGFEFHGAERGKQGLQLAASLLPDVIIIDKVLPDMDGIEVLRTIRRNDRLSTVPVIMLSGHADEPARIRALRAGADDFIAKPFSTKELLARIRANVHMAQARRAAVLRESEVLRLRQSQQELRKLLDTIQKVRADERRFLAREIHDQLGQLLTVAKIEIRLLEERTRDTPATPGPAPIPNELRSALSSIDLAIASVQNISILLRPPALENGGLLAALRWQAADCQRRARIPCTVVHDEGGYIEPSQFVAGELLRICQEALTNVLRHANATCVQIRVTVRGSSLVVRVCDNGEGFSRRTASRPNAIGIAGMRERAASIRATLHIRGRAARGTILTIRRRLALP